MRKILNMDAGWRFHLGDVTDGGFMGYDDSGWRTVRLPHDWAVEHPFDRAHASGTGYLPGGTAWYRKTFTLGEEITGKSLVLTFQGVYKHAKVWVNSHYMGFHAYGYTEFSYRVTDFLRPGENVIAVRVEHEEVADSRWYTGSGITRHVLLKIVDGACFEKDHFPVNVVGMEGNALKVEVDYRAVYPARYRFSLLTPEGTEVASRETKGYFEPVILKVPRPRFWCPEDPYLYTIRGEVIDGGTVTDVISHPCGLRVFRFDPDKGFFLNEENIKIRGVCVHHDAGCLGAAVPKDVWRRRLLKFKAAGCNAIRTAHNPPDPDLLDLCDELGFLVMDEAFDEWEGIKNKWWQGHNVYPPKHYGYGEDFPQHYKEDLSSMVSRDKHHPSVIIWSIGNEIDYPNDPYVTPLFREVLGNNDADKPLAERLYDPRKPDASRLAKVAETLVEIVHDLDDTRPVTSALSFPELSNRTGFADKLDIVGYNYREHFYEDDHKEWPDRVILGSENSHDPACWKAVEDHDFISAQFLWTGIDFLGECKGWPVRISQAGMMDLAGFEKPLYDRRRALWTKDPALKLCVEEEQWRQTYRWTGTPSEEKTVVCHTNLPEAELWLNGTSLGKRSADPADPCRLAWKVPFVPGTLRVTSGECEDELYTPDPATEILPKPDKAALKPDGADVVQVELYLKDRNGHPAVDETIRVAVAGGATLLGMENGRPDDLTPYTEPYRSTKEGRLILYLRSDETTLPATLHVWTDTGLTSRLDIPKI